ncbi:beta-galactosidase-like [Mizuhopecten yessoensis]|uniref:Beta-galactosidase n=1 Tax=Mizuhopecten yessoensis TaxID=6573 RepID=A0A210QG24_MIZYE|nr:beta-galactosidase-like [Mizuhopecten yessoensis]OWF47700.1 Beta-galactosidase [Mizuhopecten yessoensis]
MAALLNVLVVTLCFPSVIFSFSSIVTVPTRTFTVDYKNNTFLKDGKPFRYVSGSIHYSRVPQDYWKDRLLKMYAAGLDAIQLYIPWNVHQPTENTFDFEGQNDVMRFMSMANEIGLLVVVRAGPYIDGEWEFGGLPAWILQKNPNTVFRTMDPTYIHYVDLWFDKLLPMLRPLLYSNGGPVIMVQIENEYGSYYACDRNYTSHLRDKFVFHLQDEVLLFTTDGTLDSNFKCGPIPGIFATTDFGALYSPERGFRPLRKYQPNGPLVNSEFYTGWLDHWGHKHETVNKLIVSVTLDLLLKYGANVNMYMFEGGTNFGYWNGADDLPYLPVPTSYDYDAPLTEAGDITEKYKLISHVISKYKPMPPIPWPPSTPKANYGPVKMRFVGSVLDLLDHLTHGPPIKSLYPVSMESIGQFQGFTLYRHTLTSDLQKNTVLNVPGLRDRAYVMVNKVSVGVLVRDTRTSLSVTGMKGQNLDILVENQGHITFNRGINDNLKGIIQNVTLGGQVLQGWTMYPLQLDNYFSLAQNDHRSNKLLQPNVTFDPSTPSLYVGELTITSDLQDTYLDMTGWKKGQVFIKSQAVVNLGRYWPLEGPQVRLFVPGPYLQRGSAGNQILLVELEGSPCVSSGTCVVNFVDTPLINGTVHSHR